MKQFPDFFDLGFVFLFWCGVVYTIAYWLIFYGWLLGSSK